jgi:hypothetical protein
VRLLRLALRHYRGIEHTEVRFNQRGVTVIAGPNEVGKTSLAEAMDLLFDTPDSSSAQAVRAVQPVHRDEGTTVELEFTAGPYRVTYIKCYNRGRRTELRVHEPRPENLTGREAHERARAILEETVDLGLWRALRMQQDAPLDYPDLAGHASLAAALDRAAGHAGAGDDGASLFDAAQAESERYWTATGQPRPPLRDAAAAAAAVAQRVSELEQQIAAVERDVEECARLDRAIADAEAGHASLEAAAESGRADVARIEALEREHATLADRLQAADALHGSAALRLASRTGLIEQLEAARTAYAGAAAALAERAPAHDDAQAREAAARGALDAAHAAAAEASAAFEEAERDLEYRRAELEHAQLSERLERIVVAERDRAAAAAVLEANRVDADRLAAIRAAHMELEKARSRAEAGLPRLEIEALRDVDLRGAATARLVAGERWSTAAGEPVELVIGDVARVRVAPAAEARTLQEALHRAAAAYRARLEGAGVTDLDTAERTAREREDADRTLAGSDRVVAENLRDLSRAGLEQKAERCRARMLAYPPQRTAAAPLPATFDEAQERLRETRAARDAAARAVDSAAALHRALRERLDALDLEAAAAHAGLEQQASAIRGSVHQLERARAEADDATLERAAADTGEQRGRLRLKVDVARAALDAADPAQIRQHAVNADAAVQASARRIDEMRGRRIAVHARLESAGEKGLAEALDQARADAARRDWERAALERRAAAARMLFETLRTRRDEAHRRYVRPLTDLVDRLGRHVFGAGFAVSLSPDLRVEQRTLHGRTVPFASLSGGAREQISLLVRLACALTVAADGGVPLIFDDALGNSDAGRLDALGAVLALAGRECQVIVLTCAPERFRNIGSAEVVALAAS